MTLWQEIISILLPGDYLYPFWQEIISTLLAGDYLYPFWQEIISTLLAAGLDKALVSIRRKMSIDIFAASLLHR